MSRSSSVHRSINSDNHEYAVSLDVRVVSHKKYLTFKKVANQFTHMFDNFSWEILQQEEITVNMMQDGSQLS